ncbi:MAG: hypothetical protein ACWGSD_16480, partial [Thermodesulfobacteriota bacterium]
RPVGEEAHAHLNVDHRSGTPARRLRDHIDGRVERAGLSSWSGEVNAVAGTARYREEFNETA